MQRRNPGQAGLPNAPIDLTSLLDIIFIFLFVVIISNASAVLDAKHEAKKEVNEAAAAVEALEEEKARLQFEVSALWAERASNASIREAYEGEVIGKRVKIVTIYCTYDKEDHSGDPTRWMFADAPGLEFETFEFQAKTQNNAYERLKRGLQEYIEEVQSADKTEKSERTLIILHVNKELILRRDKENIDKLVIEALEDAYEDVY